VNTSLAETESDQLSKAKLAHFRTLPALLARPKFITLTKLILNVPVILTQVNLSPSEYKKSPGLLCSSSSKRWPRFKPYRLFPASAG
jgi:SET domain-containing protein